MDEAKKNTDNPSDENQSQFLTGDTSSVPPENQPVPTEGSGFIISDNTTVDSSPVSDTGSTFITNEPPINPSQVSSGSWSGIRFTSTFTDVEPLSQQGAMSLVQKARLDGRWVVVKRLLPEHRSNPAYVELFFKEYFNGRDLQHEHIVNIYGRGEDTEGPFFYMEYVDGQPLSHRISANGIREERLIRKVAGEILDALSYAHKKQVYHRDLKPDNILITNRGDNVKIIDFGLAAADTFDDLQGATFIGTKKYAAPEQTFNPKSVDGRADLYAFGIVLLEMFTDSTDNANIQSIKPAFWREIITRCLQQEPQDRFHNADEILNILESNTSQYGRVPNESPVVNTPTQSELLKKKEEELHRKELELKQREQQVKQQTKPPVSQVYTSTPPEVPPKKPNYGWVWWIVGLIALGVVSLLAQEQEDRFMKVILSLVAFGIIILLFIGVIRWWQRLNIGWKVLLVGILGFGGYYYYQQQQQEKDAVIGRLTNAATLRSQVEEYYQAMEKHNFPALESYYAPSIERYFDRKELTITTLQPLIEKYWARTPEDHHEIDWDTFTHELSDDNDYVTVTFFMNYRFRRQNAGNLKTVRAKTVMKLDKDLKVFYVAGG
jgi:hypothetical protein